MTVTVTVSSKETHHVYLNYSKDFLRLFNEKKPKTRINLLLIASRFYFFLLGFMGPMCMVFAWVFVLVFIWRNILI